MPLPNDVLVYPAHGAGSLCGKALSQQNTSTIGAEKMSNWSLQPMSEDDFVKQLLADQPFVPKYFPYEVGVNKNGAKNFAESISKVQKKKPATIEESKEYLDPSILIIDTRPQEQFKKSHLKHAINLMDDTSFETWLGSIVNPGEPFYLIAEEEEVLDKLIERVSKIGYEKQISSGIISDFGDTEMKLFDSEELRSNEDAFTIVDIRNPSEVKTQKIFPNAIHIPLYELRERVDEIPVNKPIVVHCQGGYRSAAGSSIIKSKLNGTADVYDLGEAVKTFQ
jgi:hydroxyacylglutathione hydrolase